MKLQVTYVPNTGVQWKGLIAKIGYGEGTFTQLGLRKGQSELSPQEVAWLTAHEDEIIVGCEAQAACFKDWLKITSEERKARQAQHQSAMRRKNALLEQFCKECDIKDS